MGGASSYEWNSGAMRGKGQEEGWGEGAGVKRMSL